MTAALALPRLLDQIADRQVMIPAAGMLGVTLLGFAAVLSLSSGTAGNSSFIWPSLLAAWTLLGVAYSAVMTPSGRLLRRSAHPSDRPAVFAAQFALSHACWLLTYPIAGWLSSVAGIVPTLLALAALTFAGLALAIKFWPVEDLQILPHEHPNLPSNHPHLRGSAEAHAHSYVIDEIHRRWP